MKCLKKLLLLFLLFCTFMFCIPVLNNNVFAATFNNLEFPEFKDKMTDEYDACFIYKKTSDECIYLVVYSTTYPTENLSLYGYLPYYVKYSSGAESISTGIYRYYKLDNNNNWVLDSYSISTALNVTLSLDNLYYSSVDIKDTEGNVVFKSTTKKNDPYIVNSLDDLSTWKFDNLWVDYGDYDINKTIYLHICKKTVDVSGASSFYYTDSVIALSANGKYYESYEDGQVYYFSISKDNLPFTVSAGDKIIFYLSSSASNLGGAYSSDEPLKDSSIFDTKAFTVGSSYTDEDKQKDYQGKIASSLDDQKQAIEENTKTNKNIFEKIGDILSYINPFSENFFGKKLVELILDGLKGLFVPEEGFFDTYFSDLKNWFSDRLGFLWTPFDIIIEILNKILNINFSEPIFHIPEINEPFSGSKLICEYDYNLNDLLDNEVFKNIHNIYFISVDAVIIFALINLARRKIEEVFCN